MWNILLETFVEEDLISPSECMTATALQISFLCSAVSRHKTADVSYDLALDDEYQQQVLDILDCAVRQHDQHVVHATLLLVQVGLILNLILSLS